MIGQLLTLWFTTTCLANVDTLPVPATLDGHDVGEVQLCVRETELVAVELRSLKPVLQKILPETGLSKLGGEDPGWVDVSTLESAGVKVNFDLRDLVLHLQVPPENRRPETISFLEQSSSRQQTVAHPAEFSAIMNFWGGVEYYEGCPGWAGRAGGSAHGSGKRTAVP
ncbi:MAG: hypothetical protein N3G20_03585, partial [Verrucomicrobiae bacterium]|nr:hypothetical protein [Verrucomicrobiae bacterium]